MACGVAPAVPICGPAAFGPWARALCPAFSLLWWGWASTAPFLPHDPLRVDGPRNTENVPSRPAAEPRNTLRGYSRPDAGNRALLRPSPPPPRQPRVVTPLYIRQFLSPRLPVRHPDAVPLKDGRGSLSLSHSPGLPPKLSSMRSPASAPGLASEAVTGPRPACARSGMRSRCRARRSQGRSVRSPLPDVTCLPPELCFMAPHTVSCRHNILAQGLDTDSSLA